MTDAIKLMHLDLRDISWPHPADERGPLWTLLVDLLIMDYEGGVV